MRAMPKFSMGKDERKADFEKKSIRDLPPPNLYNVSDGFTKASAARWGFGTSKRD